MKSGNFYPSMFNKDFVIPDGLLGGPKKKASQGGWGRPY
jgi:hypothetical protein